MLVYTQKLREMVWREAHDLIRPKDGQPSNLYWDSKSLNIPAERNLTRYINGKLTEAFLNNHDCKSLEELYDKYPEDSDLDWERELILVQPPQIRNEKTFSRNKQLYDVIPLVVGWISLHRPNFAQVFQTELKAQQNNASSGMRPKRSRQIDNTPTPVRTGEEGLDDVTARNPVEELQGFQQRVDRFLSAAPFSGWLLSVHVSFAALYVFLAMAFVWAVGGVLDLGQNTPLLPGQDTSVRMPVDDFDVIEIVSKRFNILAIVCVIALIFVAGVITAITRSAQDRENPTRLGVVVALATVINCVVLWLSGVIWLFALLYALVLSLAVIIGHRSDLRTALAAIFPIAILLSVGCAISVSLVFPATSGPGGILPVATALVLLMGGVAGENRGGMAVIFCAVAFTVVFGLLNTVYFTGWFRLEKWDPGTVTTYLILPVLNGFWDWLSLSATRRLASSAIDAAVGLPRNTASLILARAAVIDTALALVFVTLLFGSIEFVTWAYNSILHDGETRSSLSHYFISFQTSLFDTQSLFVILLITTVFLPTIVHVHVVTSALVVCDGSERSGFVGITRRLIYTLIMAIAFMFLLLLAQGALHVVSATFTSLTPSNLTHLIPIGDLK